MAAIFIESDNTRGLKLLTEMAEQLGLSVNKLSKPQAEKLHLSIGDHAEQLAVEGNSFIALRRSIKQKMTAEQIDEQMKSIREEWQRDI